MLPTVILIIAEPFVPVTFCVFWSQLIVAPSVSNTPRIGTIVGAVYYDCRLAIVLNFPVDLDDGSLYCVVAAETELVAITVAPVIEPPIKLNLTRS